MEVTEDAFIAKNQFQKQVLPMLRNVRARVSIDDFGTGYPSLSVLAEHHGRQDSRKERRRGIRMAPTRLA